MKIDTTEITQTTAPAIGYIPGYVLPFFSFYNADNMAIMKTFKDKEFDLAIVDPPYGIGAGSKKFINRNTANKRAEKFYKENDWDTLPQGEYWSELKRVCKNYIVWGGNYFTEFIEPSRCFIVWDKKTGANSYADCELALTNIDGNAKIVTKFWLGAHAEDNDGRIHPTQKPIYVYEFLLKEYAKDGFKILDTHLGSGSIAIAIDKANKFDNMNLEFVGIELDKEYFDASVSRFDNYQLQGTLIF
jgi:site-specific DNA-methyltransferase (adenine-specific)